MEEIKALLKEILAVQKEHLAIIKEQVALANKARESGTGASEALNRIISQLPPQFKGMVEPLLKGVKTG